MTLINKNDVNQIFAINAPAQDKPASFANYPNGWDTARSNNGRPTIRQFNFLQQRTDQNILWIHQNGAALPYDSNIEYADGAVVVKDGELQQKSGSNWNSIGGGRKASDISDAIANVNQQLINNSRLTVDSFGAKGDGVTDDSAAFQAYIDSALTSMTVFLGHRQAVYKIKKQVDFKGKGLVGHGFSRQDNAQYNHTSVYVDGSGDFANENPILNNCAFVNVGNEIRDLQLFANAEADSVNGMHLRSGYNVTFSNVNIRGFYNQVYISSIAVAFRVSDFTSISARNAGFYFSDVTNKQSTTAYFARCSWQWGKCPVLFEKEAFGCSFRDIIIEYMETGLTAKVWSNCIFDNIWAEETLKNQPADWLVNTQNQQSFNNQYSNLYIRSPWTTRADPNAVAVTDAIGGVTIENSQVAVCGATGAKVVLDSAGIKTRFANWFGTSNSPVSNRRLSISTQDTAENSNFKTPISIEAPNGCLYLRNPSANDYTPVTVRTLIGANADNTSAYYGVSTYTRKNKRWTTQEVGSGSTGEFYAPMMLTWWGQETTQQSNNGWTIRKETATGQFVVERVSGNTDYLSKPQIIVSGVVNGSGVGNLTPTVHAVQMIENYTGSWLAYGQCAGFRIAFKDITGAAVDVQRFTVAFTSNR